MRQAVRAARVVAALEIERAARLFLQFRHFPAQSPELFRMFVWWGLQCVFLQYFRREYRRAV